MTCAYCTNPTTGLADTGCRGCRLRAIARGPEFFSANATCRMTPAYKALLVAEFGDGWKAGHEEVKREAARLAALKDPA